MPPPPATDLRDMERSWAIIGGRFVNRFPSLAANAIFFLLQHLLEFALPVLREIRNFGPYRFRRWCDHGRDGLLRVRTQRSQLYPQSPYVCVLLSHALVGVVALLRALRL